MPLSPAQKRVAVKMSKAAQNPNDPGCSRARQFFADVESKNPKLYEEYAAVLNGTAEGSVNIRRTAFKTDTSLLSNKQFQVAVMMAQKAKDGIGEGINFFASQDEQAHRGIRTAKVYLAILDEYQNQTDEDRKAAIEQAIGAVAKPAPSINKPPPQTSSVVTNQEKPTAP
jgi:hypothetical protein